MEVLGRLKEVLQIYRPVIDFYVGTSGQAKRARKRLPKGLLRRKAWHATIHGHCEQLLSSVDGRCQDDILVENVLKAASRLLKVLESKKLIRYGGRRKADVFKRLQKASLSEKMVFISLATPNIQTQEKLEIALERCVKALRADDVSSAILPMAQTNQEWRRARHVCEGLLALRHDLEARLGSKVRCRCRRTHAAVFSFTSPCDTSHRSARYRLSYHHRPHSWRDAEVHGIGSGAGSRRGDEAGPPHPRPDHFCDLFLRNKGRLSVGLSHDGLEIHSPAPKKGIYASTAMVSLRSPTAKQTLLAELQEAEEVDRLCLALLLSYAYLYLSGSPWWPDTTLDPDVWLLATEDSPSRRWRQPFLHFEPSTSEKGSGPFRMEWCVNGKRPSLPAFGMLLLEIWTGREPVFETVAIQEAEKICSRTVVGQSFFRLFQTCMSGDPELQQCGPLDGLPQLRLKFVQEVVCVLQYWLSLAVNGPQSIMPRSIAPKDDGIDEAMRHLLDQLSDPVHAESDEVPDEDGYDALDHEILAGNATGTQTASRWLKRIRQKVHPFIREQRSGGTIGAAVIDTGISFNARQRLTVFHERVTDYRSWCFDGDAAGVSALHDGVPDPQLGDRNGHGTHIASVLHQVAPDCDLFIAQVFDEDRPSLGSNQKPSEAMSRRIAQAIEYARREWQVQIISLSFGFPGRSGPIYDAIEDATKAGIVIFAAAHNEGANEPVAWPAAHDRVICVHATDASGNPYGGNPNPNKQPSQFATLGCDVPSFGLDGPETIRSGTSIATPIAAGIAVLIMDLMQRAFVRIAEQGSELQQNYFAEQIPKLRTCSGMTAVLQLMVDAARPSALRERYLAPWHTLCHSELGDSYAIESILKALETSG